MATTQQQTEDFVRASIMNELRKRISEVTDEELIEMHKRVAKRIKGEIDAIALSVFSNYDMVTDTRGLHITVRKEI